jgi:5-(carboxyamino)imidazole ribonucleotide mutase
MGSKSDWETMREASRLLERLLVPHGVQSCFRASDCSGMAEYASSAVARGLRAIIAGAGGAAPPGMIAAQTELPVLGVPIQSRSLNGIDSLLSIVQMPAGVPVATFAIGVAGAKNAALFAASLLAGDYPAIRNALGAFRRQQTQDNLDSMLESWKTRVVSAPEGVVEAVKLLAAGELVACPRKPSMVLPPRRSSSPGLRQDF